VPNSHSADNQHIENSMNISSVKTFYTLCIIFLQLNEFFQIRDARLWL